MNDATPLFKAAKKTIVAHRMTSSLMPDDLKERLMEAAISFVFQVENDLFDLPKDSSPALAELLQELIAAVNEAAQTKYCVPHEMEIDEPISPENDQ